jgi:NADPH:quinone reductase-like Zn-dependent oxidoreductase
MTTTMKAIIATGYGSPEVLKFGEVTMPAVQEHEILVRIHASNVTRADTMMRTGKPYIGRLITGFLKPKKNITGAGFAGTVEAVGRGVGKFQKGDRVFGETAVEGGTNAEFVSIKDSAVILHMPEGMSFEDAATFADGPITSLNFLKEIAKIQPGQKVLINGASGSLGTAAVQLAKYYGAEVTGVASHRNVNIVKTLGADHIIDYTKKNVLAGAERYDIIFDTVGVLKFGKAKRILTENGQFISPVLSGSLLIQMLFTSKSKKKARFSATGLRSADELNKLMAELIEIYKAGKLKVVIDRQFPLEKVPDAHRYIDSGRKRGNVIIVHS